MILVRRRPQRQPLQCKAVTTHIQTKSNHSNITTRHALISGKKMYHWGEFLPEKRSLSLQLVPEHGTPAQQYLKSLSQLFPGDSTNLLAISRTPELQWAGAGDTTQPALKTSLLDLTNPLRRQKHIYLTLSVVHHLLDSKKGAWLFWFITLRAGLKCLLEMTT